MCCLLAEPGDPGVPQTLSSVMVRMWHQLPLGELGTREHSFITLLSGLRGPLKPTMDSFNSRKDMYEKTREGLAAGKTSPQSRLVKLVPASPRAHTPG